MYDSTKDTLLHIKRVNELLLEFTKDLITRAQVHDRSKLESPEKEVYDEWTPILAGTTYGTKEYRAMVSEMSPALRHHYENNPHHPEYYATGIEGMNLGDLVEMFFDWKAASERHKDGDIMRSIDINEKRFGLPKELAQIFKNTAHTMF